jgi:hypothetical protein
MHWENMTTSRKSRVVSIAWRVTAAALILGGGGVATTSITGVATTVTGAATTVPPYVEGAFAASASPSAIRSFAAQTDSDPTIASDYLPSNQGWAGMDGSGGSLSWQFANGWKGSGYTLSLGVPIIPENSKGSPVGTLASGATGAYNSYFVTLAKTLISDGEPNAYLRLGWEFDGSWYSWAATSASAEANFAAYFKQIVETMRGVPGAQFSFVWNPDAEAFTKKGYAVSLAYPGNSYVNFIGIDAYDQTWVSPQTVENAWSKTVLPDLNAAHAFAAEQGKPLALTEWAVLFRSDGHGLGDDPYYVENIINWMKEPGNNVAYESYFNGCNGGITGGKFPNSLAVFRAYLS